MQIDEGYFKLYRKILESPIFAHQTGLKIWIWCLAKANHKQKSVPLKIGAGTSIVNIGVGEFIFGRLKAEEELGIDGSTIYRWIKKLELMEMISVKSSSHYSIVTICNWATYQVENIKERAATEQPLSSHRAATEQPLNTTKNDNNDKNKEYIYKEKIKKFCFDVSLDFLESDPVGIIFKDWLSYKQKSENPFSNQESAEASFKILKTYSKNNIVKATELVNLAIAAQATNLFQSETKPEPPSKQHMPR